MLRENWQYRKKGADVLLDSHEINNVTAPLSFKYTQVTELAESVRIFAGFLLIFPPEQDFGQPFTPGGHLQFRQYPTPNFSSSTGDFVPLSDMTDIAHDNLFLR